jgi:general secretion pathway protein G
MIELIFVIVVIGILAAVAIPKLAATRGDAEGAKIAHELSVCIEDAGSRYMIDASFGGVTQSGATQSVSCRHADRCFNFTENDTAGTIKVVNDPAQTDAICTEAQRIASQNLLATTHTIYF